MCIRDRKDTFVSLEAIEIKTGETYIFDKDACAFGYRESIFKKEEKGNYFIYSVEFKLAKHPKVNSAYGCLLYTSDAADERSSVDLGGRRIIKKKNKKKYSRSEVY